MSPETVDNSSTTDTTIDIKQSNSHDDGDGKKNVSSMNLDRLPLYGRFTELKRMQNAFEMILNYQNEKSNLVEVILVHGAFGTGKTKLIERFRADNHDRAFFVHGKCEMQFESLPYAPIIKAFDQLTNIILKAPNRDDILSAIRQSLRPSETVTLAHAIPSLKPILSVGDSDKDYSLSTKKQLSLVDDYSFLRMQEILRSFLQTVCSTLGPVILKLHDLHFADEPTLQVVRGMLSQTPRFLLVGTYADGRIPDDCPLGYFLHDLTHMMVSVLDVNLAQPSKEDMDRLVLEMTNMSEQEAEPLAQFVYAKSKGNTLYAQHLFQTLQRKGYLKVHDSEKWEWHGEGQHLESLISNDLFDIVIDALKQLPSEAQLVLQLASCLGSNINLKVVAAALHSMHEIDLDDSLTAHLNLSKRTTPKLIDDLKSLLDDVIKRGLVRIKGDVYKFSHDVVQECSYQLVPEGSDRLEMHFKLGKLLNQMASDPQLAEDWMQLAAVNHLNMASNLVMDPEARKELAKLNLRASDRVKVMSAFGPTMDYLQQGMDLLNTHDRWQKYYPLALKLGTDLARMSFICRDFVRCKHVIDEVISNAQDFHDKYNVYVTHMESLAAQGRIEEAFDVGLQVLSVLGERIKTSKISLQVSVYRLRTSLSGKAVDDVLKMSPMKGEDKLRAVKLLRTMASMAGNVTDMLFHFQSRVVRLSLKNGASPLSAFSFASIAKMLASTGNMDDGFRIGTSALRIGEKFHPSKSDGLAVAIVHTHLNHWRRPYKQSTGPLYRAYQTAMDDVDVRAAFQCAAGYCEVSHVSGAPLSVLKKEMHGFIEQMAHCKFHGAETQLLLTPQFQMILNLCGDNNDATKLVGVAMDENVFVNECVRAHNTKAIEQVDLANLQIAYYFGDTQRAYQCGQKLKDVSTTSVWAAWIAFFQGLVEVEMNRLTKQNKHLKEAKKIIKKMEKWVKEGAVNIEHMLQLLQAEVESTGGGKGDPMKQYKQAITLAGEGAYLQNHALANERAAILSLERGDTPSASEFMTEAKSLYARWGAHAKVDQIKERYQFLFYDLMTSASSKKRADRRKKEGRLSFGKKWLTQPGGM